MFSKFFLDTRHIVKGPVANDRIVPRFENRAVSFEGLFQIACVFVQKGKSIGRHGGKFRVVVLCQDLFKGLAGLFVFFGFNGRFPGKIEGFDIPSGARFRDIDECTHPHVRFFGLAGPHKGGGYVAVRNHTLQTVGTADGEA